MEINGWNIRFESLKISPRFAALRMHWWLSDYSELLVHVTTGISWALLSPFVCEWISVVRVWTWFQIFTYQAMFNIFLHDFIHIQPICGENPIGPPCMVNESLKVSERRTKNKAEVKEGRKRRQREERRVSQKINCLLLINGVTHFFPAAHRPSSFMRREI